MGAFFLHALQDDIDLSAVRSVFAQKGFDEPAVYVLGNRWRLFHYAKQVVAVENHFASASGVEIFSVGTPIYRGRSYEESLRCLLRDFEARQLDQHELIGSFCLLFWDGKTISALTDRQNTLHIFYRNEQRVVSSSFLAVVASTRKPLPVNRLATCEKLSSGLIVSPDTLVEGISCHDDLHEGWAGKDSGFCWIGHPESEGCVICETNRMDSLRNRVAMLRRHFQRIRAISNEFGGELGFSDGLDSRLILAAGTWLDRPLALHTHATAGGHDQPRRIIRKLTEGEGLEIREVPTLPFTKHAPARMEEILRENLYYFDGRNGDTLGCFSETHTAGYRKLVIGSSGFSLNGIGGEIYRNSDMSYRGDMDFDTWLTAKVFSFFAEESIANRNLFGAMADSVRQKLFNRLGEPCRRRTVDLLWRRRYFGDVRMPDGRAAICDAHNQLQFFHAPFLDQDVVRDGLRANPFIGVYSEYEADMIRMISPRLASYPSGYGYPFDKFPFRYWLHARVRGLIPTGLMYARDKSYTRRKNRPLMLKMVRLVDQTPYLRASRDVLQDAGLIGNFSAVMSDTVQIPSVFMVAEFFKLFSGKLKF